MKITLLAIGTTGDVQPLVALGLKLKEAGHEVLIATDPLFELFVRNNRLGFFSIRSDAKAFFQKTAELAAYKFGKNPFRLWREIKGLINLFFHYVGPDCWDACRTAGAIIYTQLGGYFAPHIAERLNVPCIRVSYFPVAPTRSFPSTLVSTKINFGSTLNQITWVLGDISIWLPYRTCINQFRVKHLKLPSLGVTDFIQLYKLQDLLINGFSPIVVPKPPDWGDHIHITGYWFLDSSTNWQPSPDLVDFLTAGPPPVYIGFGSMMVRKPEEITDIILSALERTKQRGVIASGWGGFGKIDLPENVFKVESVPHDWLFPQMAAVIHHGGAGTTAAGLKAGIPSIVVPISFEQPFWGQRVADLGVGPRPIPIKHLKAERLATAIKQVIGDKRMQRRAATMGERIRSEDGVTRAVEIIQHRLFSRH